MFTKKGKLKENQDLPPEEKEKPKMRQIIIETDGNLATIVKAEVAGSLELKSILQGLADKIK